ncbi:hypothetical protein [Halobacillus karajensis]|uniref:hypothetical protein n=1 Tax=Halobacillus karajensis TaxID=195088 RepID=UPI00045C39FF|nr:hypothetical protein [Halobacillus karajensis]CDQ17973.1 hypothetical protein BN982_00213 [Halobacillus karajensis]
MSETKFEVLGGRKSFDFLNKSLFKENRKRFEALKVSLWLELLKKGERPTKWLKPTNKGIEVDIDFIKNQEDADLGIQELKKYISKTNKDVGTDFELE